MTHVKMVKSNLDCLFCTLHKRMTVIGLENQWHCFSVFGQLAVQKDRSDGHDSWATLQKCKMTASESSQENGKAFSLNFLLFFHGIFLKVAQRLSQEITAQLLFLFCHVISTAEQTAAPGRICSYQNAVLCPLCFLRSLSCYSRWLDPLLFLKALFKFLLFLSGSLTHLPSSGYDKWSSSLSWVWEIQKQK